MVLGVDPCSGAFVRAARAARSGKMVTPPHRAMDYHENFNFGDAQPEHPANPLDGLPPEQAREVMLQQIALYLSKGAHAKGSADEKKKFNEERAKAGNVITQYIKSQNRNTLCITTPEGPRWLHVKEVKRKATTDSRFVASVFYTYGRHKAAEMQGRPPEDVASHFSQFFEEMRVRAGDTEEKLVILKSEPKASEAAVRDLTSVGPMV